MNTDLLDLASRHSDSNRAQVIFWTIGGSDEAVARVSGGIPGQLPDLWIIQISNRLIQWQSMPIQCALKSDQFLLNCPSAKAANVPEFRQWGTKWLITDTILKHCLILTISLIKHYRPYFRILLLLTWDISAGHTFTQKQDDVVVTAIKTLAWKPWESEKKQNQRPQTSH